MYESFFGLTDRPFAAAPAASRYFAAGVCEAARHTLARCIERQEGLGLLVGPAGTGKSVVCQVLAEQFRTRLAVALLASGRLGTRRILLQAILFELGLPYRGLDEGELRLSLVDHLGAGDPQHGGLLLIVDEAHTLPLRLLEELRLISNVVRHGHSRVRVVLAACPALEERLASPKMESFNQRISARCYLQALTRDETLAYVRHAIARAGGNPERVFSGEALVAIHRATDGIPRLINQLCDHALLLASTAGVPQVSAAVVEEAWADLQHLPTPWNSAAGVAQAGADIIELGSLDEDLPAAAAVWPIAQSAPRLRTVAPPDDELLFEGEPAERIQRIGERLEAAETGVQPADALQPEVELVFAAAADPFGEEFVDEEPVVDRFAAWDTNPLAHAPTVTSAEGRELSALLAPFTQPRAEAPAAAKIASESQREESPHPQALRMATAVANAAKSAAANAAARKAAPPVEASAEDDSAAADAWQEVPTLSWEDAQRAALLNPADDPVLPEDPALLRSAGDSPPERPTIPLRAESLAVEPEAVVELVAEDLIVHPVATTSDGPADESASENDADIIVVEDDPPPPAPLSPQPGKPRRHEYRQLFARLRRS